MDKKTKLPKKTIRIEPINIRELSSEELENLARRIIEKLEKGN